jgi:kinesin family member 20
MRSAVIEAETREEVMREMEERIREMEKRFTRRLMNEVRLSHGGGRNTHLPFRHPQVELNEIRMDAKIDMLHHSGLIGKTPSQTGPQVHKSTKSNVRVKRSEVSRMAINKLQPE